MHGAHSPLRSIPACVDSLGVTVGSPQAPRIVAVSTASVFDDPTLIRSHLGLPPDGIDTGFHGQLYTRPGDVLVVRVEAPDVARLAKVATAIDVNRQLWLDLTGIELLSSSDEIVVSTSETAIQPVLGERSIFPGSLTDAAAYHFRRSGLSLYAFTCDLRLLQALQFTAAENSWLWRRAHTTSALMNKASAVGVLSVARGIMCPTHCFTADDFDKRIPQQLDRRHRYVYKPSGGAAGVGVFAGSGSGATPEQIMQHVESLARVDALPAEFVVQRFVAGTPWGVSGNIAEDGSFSILGIHEQLVDLQRESVGSRWSPAIEERYRQRAEEFFGVLSQIRALRGFGAIQLDCIDSDVIEITPRLTASVPVHYY